MTNFLSSNLRNKIELRYTFLSNRSGAQVVDSSSTSTASNKPAVSGTGYRLGTGNEPTEVIRGPPAPKPPVKLVFSSFLILKL